MGNAMLRSKPRKTVNDYMALPIEGCGKLRSLREGWNAVEMPLPRQPVNSWGGGDKKYDPSGVVEFTFALASARGTVFIDDWTLVSVVPVMK